MKSGFPDTYKRVTSRDLQPTLDFGERLTKLGKKIWIRFVLVPGWTDAPENIERVAQIVSRWKSSVERVEVLPFHNMGADKWKNLDMEYKLEGREAAVSKGGGGSTGRIPFLRPHYFLKNMDWVGAQSIFKTSSTGRGLATASLASQRARGWRPQRRNVLA